MPEKSTKDDDLFAMTLFVRGFKLSKMIQVAAELGLADRIAKGPKPVAELARDLGADSAMLMRLCRALAAFGIFAVDANGTLSHTARSQFLKQDAKPTLHHAARFWTTKGNWAAWEGLLETVRTGKPGFESIFGVPVFEYLREHWQEARLFDAFMQHSPDDRHLAVVEAYDFSSAKLVVDVGGGNGALIASVLAATLETRGLVFDREEVLAGAVKTLAAHTSRSRIEAGDFFEHVPEGGDIYTLSQILHDWSDERCRAILKNCRAAMHPSAKLLVIERILSGGSKTNPMNFLSDMEMMVLCEGARERTAREYAELLQETGFTSPKQIETRSPFSILVTQLNP
ncbi:MAG TPA: methyltransferase [Micropepsaceae bacterium]|nr:methyltransferase [Micropepsaceae bacterium]